MAVRLTKEALWYESGTRQTLYFCFYTFLCCKIYFSAADLAFYSIPAKSMGEIFFNILFSNGGYKGRQLEKIVSLNPSCTDGVYWCSSEIPPSLGRQ